MYEYPELDYKTLYPILIFVLDCRKQPELIQDAPYNDHIKTALGELCLNLEAADNRENAKNLRDLDVEAETIRLYESMKSIEMKGKLDEKEKIQILKLQTSSLQDLLDMLKEAKEIKKIREFEDLIFTILTDEQKEKVKELFK
jgi:hypothetical protein